MSLARCRSTAKKLSAINKDDGNLYNMDNNRNEGIISFYENLYKKPADERLNYDNCIEDFLLAGIVNHPLVQNSMLTEDECNLLDRPLTIDDLNKSLSMANLNSSPGDDGLCNKFITKYWSLIHNALFYYCQECFEKKLTHCKFLKCQHTDPKKGEYLSLLFNMY
jgi:hypothetical protein